jgi:hypothetical protein
MPSIKIPPPMGINLPDVNWNAQLEHDLGQWEKVRSMKKSMGRKVRPEHGSEGVLLNEGKKKPLVQGAFLPAKRGDDLLSHPVSGAVPSALEGLTAVFGMGTGVAPPLWSPGFFRLQALSRRAPSHN